MKQSDLRVWRAAFTLLEILMSLAVIAIIVSISIPAFSRLQHQAQAVKCTANLRQVGVGVHLYLGENNRTFPALAAARESRGDIETPVLETVLLDYVDNEAVFDCPSDHRFFTRTGCSYFWNTLINDQTLGNMNLLGIIRQESGIPIVSDKENFHRHVGAEVNILYADGSIYKGLQFNVELDP